MSQEIMHYHVEISDNSGILGSKNEFIKKSHNVIGENSMFVVIDDLHFTTIARNKDKYRLSIDVESISVTVGDSVWGNRVSYSLYTTSEKKASSIKKVIEKAILKKIGFFMNGIDLSIIDDSTISIAKATNA